MKKVMIVEDYEVLLESYKEIINNTTNFRVCGAYTSCEEALEHIENLSPEFILIDISLPGMSGIEGIKAIKAILGDSVSIIVVSVHENSTHVFDALCAGAIGYVTKSSGEKEFLNALYQAINGGAPMSTNIARMVVESFQKNDCNELTSRENKVITLLSEGMTYNQIAMTLNLSINTIKYHLRNIYGKLYVKNKYEAIVEYKKRGCKLNSV
ncbi:response regulator transcription factor [Aquimarina algiphila]|uniref:Response regulator transcription factor n=1 Tax=Aquimarina algiphila TaxID=2047982 RepID=A0A554VP18_9FLAO|nr:response regulator transcription factor [Aquimarina algiphila]